MVLLSVVEKLSIEAKNGALLSIERYYSKGDIKESI